MGIGSKLQRVDQKARQFRAQVKELIRPTPKNAFQHLKRGPGSPAGPQLKRNMPKRGPR